MRFKIAASHWASSLTLHFLINLLGMLGRLNKIIGSSSASYQDADKVKSLALSSKINLKGDTEEEKMPRYLVNTYIQGNRNLGGNVILRNWCF